MPYLNSEQNIESQGGEETQQQLSRYLYVFAKMQVMYTNAKTLFCRRFIAIFTIFGWPWEIESQQPKYKTLVRFYNCAQVTSNSPPCDPKTKENIPAITEIRDCIKVCYVGKFYFLALILKCHIDLWKMTINLVTLTKRAMTWAQFVSDTRIKHYY